MAWKRAGAWPGALVGVVGIALALVLPFASVDQTQTTVTWPVPGEVAQSTTALFAPYRPAALAATVPCSVLRAAERQPGSVTILATAADGDGMALRTGTDGTALVLGDRSVPLAATVTGDCHLTINAGADGLLIIDTDGRSILFPDEPVPQVFAFRTELAPTDADGLSVNARIVSPFATSPSPLKLLLITGQLVAVALAMALLRRTGPKRRPRQHRWRAAWLVDIGVIGTLAGWAVIGPLAVDDGWATMIARNYAATGNPGNYYRWWDASEVPFALSQELLAPLTEVGLAPLWLRLPSTILAVATWFVLSRGVLPAALPRLAAGLPVRVTAAVCLLACWLPFNLGARPESYVALGTTAVLALLWRARRIAGLGWAALAIGVTIPISPTAVALAAPILMFSRRSARILRAGSRTRTALAAHVLLLCCVGSVGLTLIFADQTWDALRTATDWHTVFGPSLPWYHEPDRYGYLLGGGQQGSAAKRLPVLVTIALLPVVAVAVWRSRDPLCRSAGQLAAVVATALVALCLVPSKWSYHLGGLAGVFAAFLVVTVALGWQARGSSAVRLAVAAGVLLSGAAAWAFSGPDAWWLAWVYDVPWASGPVRPFDLPLNSVLFWLVLFAVIALCCRAFRGLRTAQAPAVLVFAILATSLTVLVGSFVAAPFRRSEASLAVANLHTLTRAPGCGVADAVEVMPDGAVLIPADGADRLAGFTALGGFYPGAPPPDPPGTGISSRVWGSRLGDERSTGTMTSGWFALPRLGPTDGVALSVSGRVDGGNSLTLEFGRRAGTILGEKAPIDRVPADEDPADPGWRTIGLDAADVPSSADQVRVRARDNRTDRDGWLALTGPRLRSVVGLTEYLATHGPVLLSWPQAFLFPCVRNIARVAGGLAQTPASVVESPRPRFTDDRDQAIGGTFAGLSALGLYEVPTRLIGHADVDWGALLVPASTEARDAYRTESTSSRRPGWRSP